MLQLPLQLLNLAPKLANMPALSAGKGSVGELPKRN